MANDVVDRVATFLIYTLIARYLGVFAFGQMSLAITFFQTFQLLAVVGLQTLITREVTKSKTQTRKYFINGSLVVTAFSLLSITALAILIRFLRYSTETTNTVLLLSCSLLPYSLSTVSDAIFQAWEKMFYITIANTVVNIVKIALAFLLLSQGYGINVIILLILVAYILNLITKWFIISLYITKIRMNFDIPFCISMTKTALTFLGINGAQAILTSVNVIILSKLASEVEVALFSASFQVMVPVAIIFESVSRSAFPVLCRRFESGLQRMKVISTNLMELLTIIVLPVTIGMFFFADTMAPLMYGHNDFSGASLVIRILVWRLVFRVFTQMLGQVLVASLQEKMTLRILVIDMLASVILGPILISYFGLIGAAITSVAVRVIDFIQHFIPVSHMFAGLALKEMIWRPATASVLMVLFLLMTGGQYIFLTIPLATLVYFSSIFLLSLLSFGGISQLKMNYAYLFSK
jgi:O-antigen/teichoic acid export membrane protein